MRLYVVASMSSQLGVPGAVFELDPYSVSSVHLMTNSSCLLLLTFCSRNIFAESFDRTPRQFRMAAPKEVREGSAIAFSAAYCRTEGLFS